MPIQTPHGTPLTDAELQPCKSSKRLSPDGSCAANTHGTVNAYKNHGCRCPIACRAWSHYMKDYRLRRLRGVRNLIDATGTRRRLRALQAIGWTTEALGAYLNCSGAAVSQLARRALVHRATAAKVRQVYQQLADTRGSSQYTATLAANRGWLPPIWWDDDTIDDSTYEPPTRERDLPHKTDVDTVRVARVLAGQDIDLTRAERLVAVRQLREQRLSYDAMAELLHVDQRQVARDLADLGLTHQEAGAA